MIYTTTEIPNENIADFFNMTSVLYWLTLDHLAQSGLFSFLHFPISEDLRIPYFLQLASKNLPVQSNKWNTMNRFEICKVNDEDTGTTFLTSFWCLYS